MQVRRIPSTASVRHSGPKGYLDLDRRRPGSCLFPKDRQVLAHEWEAGERERWKEVKTIQLFVNIEPLPFSQLSA